jgi:DNA helicase-2/ATP-dependent DNA helicase PcrA
MNLNAFNAAQKEAITLSIDPNQVLDILIVAGAGSGKTRVLINRIAYLREQGVMARQILGLTFTKKAANEMQGRLAGLLSDRTPVKLSTFHSLAADLLRSFRESTFDIIDDADQTRLLKVVIADLDLKDSVKMKDFKSWFGFQRNRCFDPCVPGVNDQPYIGEYREIARAYKKAKLQIGSGVLDFDDLLEELVLLLEKRPRVRQQLQDRWKYILVDEYQDTNRLQFNILKLLRGPTTQLLQVGDEDQLIYSWRGAEIDHIMRSYYASLESSEVRCVMLGTNYRCSANILSVANKIVEVNTMRTGKVLDAHNEKGEPVSVLELGSCYEESETIAHHLEKWHADGVNYSDMAVLMRTNRMARSLERALVQEGVPYHMHNGVALFDSREVRLLMSLLRFTDEPNETFFLSQVLDTIKMGIGPAAIKAMEEDRIEKNVDWITYLSEHPKMASKQRVKEFLMFYPDAKELLMEGDVSGAARSWLHNWDLMQFYKEDEREKKTETLTVFFQVIDDYMHQAKLRNLTPSMIDFQEQRLLNDALTDKDEGGAVHIMTVHKSKGLEFKRGVIMGLQDGIFPMNPDRSDEDSEEDARLAYVAITRFMEKLLITKAARRVGFNDISEYSSLLDPHQGYLQKTGAIEYE